MTPTPPRPSGNPAKTAPGVGMPAQLYLHEFGRVLFDAFGETPYHVGSSLTGATWRDVDVRIMLSREDYVRMFGDTVHTLSNRRWCAYVMAFSALGREMTGLPIDFQIQEVDKANEEYGHGHLRSALILGRLKQQERDEIL